MERLWIAFWTSLTFVSWATSGKVVLMETPNCDRCVWTWDTYQIGINGWHHPSQGPRNRYTLCYGDSNGQQPNSWLRSRIISLGDIQRLEVTVEYFLTNCPSSFTFCNESLFAYVWESNTSVLSDKIPHPISSFGSYRLFAIINRPPNNPTVLTIPLEVKSKFIVLGFRDQGGCRTLFSVKISYNVCPVETLKDNLVSLPRTSSPFSSMESIPVNGSCATDSVQAVQGSMSVLCESSGEWNTSSLEGKCFCKENMENAGGICKACSRGTYNEGNGLNCTVIPSEPRDAVASFVNNISAVISWSPPAAIGTETDVLYDIECQKLCDYYGKRCDDEECHGVVSFLFKMEELNMTNITITNLTSFVNYTCKISTKNRVSKVAERNHGVKGNFALINLRTNGTAPGKPEVAVHLAEDGNIELSWKLRCKNGIIEGYRVTYVRMDDSSDTEILITKNKEVRIKSLASGKTYEFRVFALNNFGTGPPGVKTFKIPSGPGPGPGPDPGPGGQSDLSPKSKAVIAGAAGGGALLLIIILVVVIVFVCRVRRRSARSIQKDYMRTLEQGLGSDLPLDQRRYIDPGNYLDLMEMLTTFTSEIERSKTKLEGMIGQGEFADVYKGTLQTSKGKQIVAVKVLRPGSNEKNQKDFLAEASIMGQFHHPNVIQLIGVVTQSRPMMILTEFLESGSLDHFLKNRNGQLTVFQLLGMARGVACGMVYLAEMNFIHRDLAARNILVGENMSCKVSDFGLSRELSDDTPDSEYETQGGKIPVRWTAPEALQHRKFSSASDVWSYGILLWEIMSFSDRPYWDWNNYDVINRVETGYRLPPPTGCPKVVHGLMQECWESDKNKRPKFADIVIRLDELFRFPEVLNDNLLSVTNDSEKDAPPEFQSVDEWLTFINMEKYVDVFLAANINNLENVARLRDSDLREMGISLIGHRNKMNKSIRAMNTHFVNRGLDIDEAAI